MALKTPPLLATLITILAIIILCSLGTWQLKRLEWKQTIIKNLNAAYDTPNPPALTTESLKTQQFAYGSITGKLITEKAILLGPRSYGDMDRKIGNHLIVPLSHNNQTYLINLGWTDQPLANLDLPKTSVTINGLARQPDWNSFTPDNQIEKNVWYKPDIQEIAAAKGLDNAAPYIVYADTVTGIKAGQFKNHDKWTLKNDHAGYALFWFSMAVALLVIFALRFIIPRRN